MALKIRRDDTVVVIAGKDKGKRGRVIQVLRDGQKVLVEKINMVKRHSRPSPKYQQGGIIDKEAPLDVSNVMLVDPKSGEPVKPKFRVEGADEKVRYNPKTGEAIDQ